VIDEFQQLLPRFTTLNISGLHP
jgi:hypothetical protein